MPIRSPRAEGRSADEGTGGRRVHAAVAASPAILGGVDAGVLRRVAVKALEGPAIAAAWRAVSGRAAVAVDVTVSGHAHVAVERGVAAVVVRRTGADLGWGAVGVGQTVIERAGSVKARRERRSAPIGSAIGIRAARRKPAVCKRVSRSGARGCRPPMLRRNLGGADFDGSGAASGAGNERLRVRARVGTGQAAGAGCDSQRQTEGRGAEELGHRSRLGTASGGPDRPPARRFSRPGPRQWLCPASAAT